MFDFDQETRRKLGYKLIDHINAYFTSLPDRPVQLPAELRTFGGLRDQMPEVAEDAGKVLDEICRELVDKGFHVPSANYFGLMNPTPTYMAVLAEALVAALNPQLATLARSQLASKIEHETVRWIGERVGWGVPFNGTFTTGGNEANFSALALALATAFPGTVENGIASIGAQPVFYASAEAHHSLDKSSGLLGIGRKAMRRIPVNDRLQLDVNRLESAIVSDLIAGHRPFCVVATAGTTNSGAVDDIRALAEICRRHKLWLHVDGAYGGALLFSDKHRHILDGIALADSLTLDPHKWLAMPFATGVILTSHPDALLKTFAVVTPYMPKIAADTALIDNFKISTQWSRRMNSLKLWLTLRVHGRIAYEQLIDRQMQMANSFVDWLNASKHFELATVPTLPIVNFRVKIPDGTEAEIQAANEHLVNLVTEDGTRWLSVTHVNGRSVIRMMVISYLSEDRHLEGLEEALTLASKKLTHAMAQSSVIEEV